MSKNDDILIEEVRELLKADRDNTAVILNERRRLSEPLTPDEARRKMAAMTRRSFLIGGAAAAFGVLGWRWMSDETKQSLFRHTFEFNERVSQILYKPSRLAPEFPLSRITEPARVNGDLGLKSELDTATWKLTVTGLEGRTDDLVLTLDDIKKLPRTEMITELKCIEGWSVIVHWVGVKFADFIAKYPPRRLYSNLHDVRGNQHGLVRYVSLSTADNEYFVGWDIESIMHPQTLLAYEMNGRPLTPEHGAPLRLASPTKYGIKQIKRIGRIEFTNERPRDYWTEQGYDWYAGL